MCTDSNKAIIKSRFTNYFNIGVKVFSRISLGQTSYFFPNVDVDESFKCTVLMFLVNKKFYLRTFEFSFEYLWWYVTLSIVVSHMLILLWMWNPDNTAEKRDNVTLRRRWGLVQSNISTFNFFSRPYSHYCAWMHSVTFKF